MSRHMLIVPAAEFDVRKLAPTKLMDLGSSMQQAKFTYDGHSNFVIATDVIEMNYGGIPGHTEDFDCESKRQFCSVPMDPNGTLMPCVEAIQEYVTSDEFVRRVVGEEEFQKYRFWNEYGLVKEPSEKQLERDPNSFSTVKLKFDVAYNPSDEKARKNAHDRDVQRYKKNRVPEHKRVYKFDKPYSDEDNEILTEVNVVDDIEAECFDSLEKVEGLKLVDQLKKNYLCYRNKAIFFFTVNKLWILKTSNTGTKQDPRRVKKFGVNLLLKNVICQKVDRDTRAVAYAPNRWGLGTAKKVEKALTVEELQAEVDEMQLEEKLPAESKVDFSTPLKAAEQPAEQHAEQHAEQDAEQDAEQVVEQVAEEENFDEEYEEPEPKPAPRRIVRASKRG